MKIGLKLYYTFSLKMLQLWAIFKNYLLLNWHLKNKFCKTHLKTLGALKMCTFLLGRRYTLDHTHTHKHSTHIREKKKKMMYVAIISPEASQMK